MPGRLSDRDAVASLLSGEAPSSGVLGALQPLGPKSRVEIAVRAMRETMREACGM